jgi:hypothetical protein
MYEYWNPYAQCYVGAYGATIPAHAPKVAATENCPVVTIPCPIPSSAHLPCPPTPYPEGCSDPAPSAVGCPSQAACPIPTSYNDGCSPPPGIDCPTMYCPPPSLVGCPVPPSVTCPTTFPLQCPSLAICPSVELCPSTHNCPPPSGLCPLPPNPGPLPTSPCPTWQGCNGVGRGFYQPFPGPYRFPVAVPGWMGDLCGRYTTPAPTQTCYARWPQFTSYPPLPTQYCPW